MNVSILSGVYRIGEWKGRAHPLLILFVELLLFFGHKKATKGACVGEVLQKRNGVSMGSNSGIHGAFERRRAQVLLIDGPVCPRNAGRCYSW